MMTQTVMTVNGDCVRVCLVVFGVCECVSV